MVEKLNDIIKDRYGKGFSVRQLSQVDSLSSTEANIRGNDLYVPIMVKEVFLGYGLVHQAHDLSKEQIAHISRLVRMILEPSLYAEHLDRTLHNMEAEKSRRIDVTGDPTKSIFIFGHHASRVQKISLEIHDISQNWTYLPFKDIQTSIQNIADFANLEGTTLVVNLEERISSDKQKILINYLKEGMTGTLLIFVSSKPSYQLLEAGLIESDLHEILKSTEFSVDRLPIERSTLKDVLEMLYFQS